MHAKEKQPPRFPVGRGLRHGLQRISHVVQQWLHTVRNRPGRRALTVARRLAKFGTRPGRDRIGGMRFPIEHAGDAGTFSGLGQRSMHRRHRKNRQVLELRLRAEGPHDAHPIKPWEHEIEDDESRRIFVEDIDGRIAIASHLDGDAG